MNKQVRFVCFLLLLLSTACQNQFRLMKSRMKMNGVWLFLTQFRICYFFSPLRRFEKLLWFPKVHFVTFGRTRQVIFHHHAYKRCVSVCRAAVLFQSQHLNEHRRDCIACVRQTFFLFWLFSCCCYGCLLHWRVRTHSRQIVHVNLNRSPPNDKIRVFHMPNEKRVCQFTFAVAFARLSHTFPIWIYFR